MVDDGNQMIFLSKTALDECACVVIKWSYLSLNLWLFNKSLKHEK